MRALLVSMPFADVRRPSIALGLLKAALHRDGVACDVVYLNLDFAARIGVENYLEIDQFAVEHLLGEWIFARALWGDSTGDPARYYSEVLQPVIEQARTSGIQPSERELPGDELLGNLVRLQSDAERFIDTCLQAYDWAKYDIVGFTTTFQQNVASLALARRVKQVRPQVCVAFGGANCEGEMGLALHRLFPFIDVVCSGEGDLALPEFVKQASQRHSNVPDIAGIIRRVDGKTVRPASLTNPVTDMDALPPPDYFDYFQQSPVLGSTEQRRTVPIESSRGCWWGEKQHCTFCGLNGGTMKFRGKSADRFLREVELLVQRHGVRELAAVDNIIDMKYFTEVLPRLASSGLSVKLFYETKANLQRSQVRLLRESGVTSIQPGIESLSSRVLQLMRKGVHAYQNIRLLKWCAEYLVEPHWNLLAGFPGEEPADYFDQAAIVPSLRHLPPPMHVTQIRLDRFSPLFVAGDSAGLSRIRAARAYQHVYPFEPSDLAQLAYYFDFDYADGRDPNSYLRDLRAEVEQWRCGGDAGKLVSLDNGDVTVICDARSAASAPQHYRLAGWERVGHGACDPGKPLADIRRALEEAGYFDISSDTLERFLLRLVDARLVVSIDGRYLSVVVDGRYHVATLAKHLAAGVPVPDDLRRAAARLFELLPQEFSAHFVRHLQSDNRNSAPEDAESAVLVSGVA